MTVNLLCFKAGSTEMPSSGASLRLVSVLILDTNQLSMEGVKVLCSRFGQVQGRLGMTQLVLEAERSQQQPEPPG